MCEDKKEDGGKSVLGYLYTITVAFKKEGKNEEETYKISLIEQDNAFVSECIEKIKASTKSLCVISMFQTRALMVYYEDMGEVIVL